MVAFYGDYDLTETVNIPFNTFSSDDPSASVTVTDLVAGDVYVHQDGVEGTPTGITVSLNVGSVNGNHLAILDLTDTNDVGFYAVGSRYQVRIEGVTIDGATINAWIGAFSIGCTLRPTTAGRTLTVESDGVAHADLKEWLGVAPLALASQMVQGDLTAIHGTALTETATQLAGAFVKFFNVSSPTGTANSLADAVPGAAGGGFIAGTNAETTVTTAINANLIGNITGNLSGSVGSVTGAVGSVTGAVGSVTGAVGSVTGLNIANGAAEADLTYIHGSALTETATQLAAAFVKFFDVAAPTATALSLPDAAPDAAGGLPISDAGGLDIDTKLANTNEVTAARMGALTDWIDGGRLDLLLDAIKAITDALPDSGALTTIGTDTARLTAARAQILTDWINGGRLDLILDTAAAGGGGAVNITTETTIIELD